ncbi:hypothetical protein [Aureimonas sp. AU20]|uniref:hypothetical protein n=1 Tax=Aureimonas sp. AU20 TaxID=1349819 RepID=UPI00071ECB49|nr:hypothetical protein [Aureimonas sp. AU20]ALN73028.1 hypothetical protein M673_09885 [Aureimonas sp. AU20]
MSNVSPVKQSQLAMGNWNLGKGVVGHFVPGGGEFMSAAAAADKATQLSDILQMYFQARDEVYDGKDIEPDDLKRALLHARGKKSTKSQRKLVIGGAKVAITVGVAATGATVGSIVPVAGTIAGGAAGYGAGMVLSTGVSALDQGKRKLKGLLKHVRGTRGKHREQAALSILYNSKKPSTPFDAKQAAATQALVALLGIEADLFFKERLTEKDQIDRLAARLKSN